LLLSLFCGAGGLDLGFEEAGFRIGLAFDKKADSVASYNHNRPAPSVAHCADVRELTLEKLDEIYGEEFAPQGVIGGPPCQSFSRANHGVADDDPRHELPLVYAALIQQLNNRSPVRFFAMENVPGLRTPKHAERLSIVKAALHEAGFNVFDTLLNACNYGTPQIRERLFVVGINRGLYGPQSMWKPPTVRTAPEEMLTVRDAISGFEEPVLYERNADPSTFPLHPNHWCMKPKSDKFQRAGALIPGRTSNRSFRTLPWDSPSMTVAYGNREVHVHPECHRRLSVYEAMLLQGFPHRYQLLGSLSSQIAQVSEAVPPGLAYAVACSIQAQLATPAIAGGLSAAA
jgi:DNA (cytosine-5)-methyltransferase 1